MNFCQSLPSNIAGTTLLDGRGFTLPIVGKEIPANPRRFEQSMQDIVEPVIPDAGPSKHRGSLVEVASPYHIEAHEESTSDTVERSSQQAAPHTQLEQADSETDVSVAVQPSTGAVAANTTTDVDPWIAFRLRNAPSSPASKGGDDGGESGDATHEREREWEREWEHERELSRRAHGGPGGG